MKSVDLGTLAFAVGIIGMLFMTIIIATHAIDQYKAEQFCKSRGEAFPTAGAFFQCLNTTTHQLEYHSYDEVK